MASIEGDTSTPSRGAGRIDLHRDQGADDTDESTRQMIRGCSISRDSNAPSRPPHSLTIDSRIPDTRKTSPCVTRSTLATG